VAAIIADEMAIGVINDKTTAVRLIRCRAPRLATGSSSAGCSVRRR